MALESQLEQQAELSLPRSERRPAPPSKRRRGDDAEYVTEEVTDNALGGDATEEVIDNGLGGDATEEVTEYDATEEVASHAPDLDSSPSDMNTCAARLERSSSCR